MSVSPANLSGSVGYPRNTKETEEKNLKSYFFMM